MIIMMQHKKHFSLHDICQDSQYVIFYNSKTLTKRISPQLTALKFEACRDLNRQNDVLSGSLRLKKKNTSFKYR